MVMYWMSASVSVGSTNFDLAMLAYLLTNQETIAVPKIITPQDVGIDAEVTENDTSVTQDNIAAEIMTTITAAVRQMLQ